MSQTPSLSYTELQELILNEPESKFREGQMNENERNSLSSTDPTQNTSESSLENKSDVMIIEELVYPYEMTVDMLRQYRQFSSMNLDQDLTMMFRKLYRSARYWRVDAKRYNWLLRRLG